jgi:hypothetical protein
MNESLQRVSSECSYKEAENVGNDHNRCRKFRLQVHLDTDDKTHRHSEHCQEQLVVYAGCATYQCYYSMEQCEYMDGPR